MDLVFFNLFLNFIFLCAVFATGDSDIYDYYWRDYNGEIPDDAVPGGLDKNNRSTYIAQAFIRDYGLLPTRLYVGSKSVTTSKDQNKGATHATDVYISILCSETPYNFFWLPAKASDVHLTTIGRHLVIGGAENGKILTIGRAVYKGEVIVGKVCSYNIGDAKLYFPYDSKEVDLTDYEILVYDPSALFPIDIRFE